MERLSVVFVWLCLICWISCCFSNQLTDSETNLYLQRALAEFENRYDSLKKELKSEINTLKATEAKLVYEINDLKHNRLKDVALISQLKTELKHTNNEFKTLRIRVDECDAITNQKWNIKVDDVKRSDLKTVYSKPSESKTITKLMSEDDILLKNRVNLNRIIGKENASHNDVPSQRTNDINQLSDSAIIHHDGDKRRDTRRKKIPFSALSWIPIEIIDRTKSQTYFPNG